MLKFVNANISRRCETISQLSQPAAPCYDLPRLEYCGRVDLTPLVELQIVHFLKQEFPELILTHGAVPGSRNTGFRVHLLVGPRTGEEEKGEDHGCARE